MRNIRISILFFLLLSFFAGNFNRLYADPLHFTHINTENGLISDETTCVIKDYMGYIWIGTINGLVRYNGYKMDVFHLQNPGTGSNEISLLYEDKQKRLWLGSANGLFKFDRDGGIFQHVNISQDNQTTESQYITCIYEAGDSVFWIGTRNGLIQFNPSTLKYSLYLSQSKSMISIAQILHYKNNLWLGSWTHGLLKFDLSSKKITSYLQIPHDIENKGNYYVLSLFKDNQNRLLIGRHNETIGLFDLNTEKFMNIPLIFQKQKISIRSIVRADNDRVWMASDRGLIDYNLKNEKVKYIVHNPEDESSVCSQDLSCIYIDNTDIMWIASLEKGISVYDPKRLKFSKNFDAINFTSNAKIASVKSISIDTKNNLWIGTDFGLNLFDKNGKLKKVFHHNEYDESSIGDGGVTSFIEDSKGNYWVGTWGGSWNSFNPKTFRFKKYSFILNNLNLNIPNSNKTLADQNILCAANDVKGNIWMGTVYGFLVQFNPENESFVHYKLKEARYLHYILPEIEKGWIWCCTKNGLYKFNVKTGSNILYQSNNPKPYNISGSSVFCIFRGINDILWLGSNAGLDKYNVVKNQFEPVSSLSKIPSLSVQTIQQDNNGVLWLGTSWGLIRYTLPTILIAHMTGTTGSQEVVLPVVRQRMECFILEVQKV